MLVSGQAHYLSSADAAERGPRARMRRLMLETAMRLMQAGVSPSVSDVAEAAQVSRATAYRYFPTQAAMIQAVVDEALGPILAWHSDEPAPERRVAELFGFAFPRMLAYEATHRAALATALGQWIRRQSGASGDEAPIVRGNRRKLLCEAAGPLREKMSAAAFDKLTQSLSLIFGIEAIIVLKDIWRLDDAAAQATAQWAARALVDAAIAQAAMDKKIGRREAPEQNAAKRSRKTSNEVQQTPA